MTPSSAAEISAAGTARSRATGGATTAGGHGHRPAHDRHLRCGDDRQRSPGQLREPAEGARVDGHLARPRVRARGGPARHRSGACARLRAAPGHGVRAASGSRPRCARTRRLPAASRARSTPSWACSRRSCPVSCCRRSCCVGIVWLAVLGAARLVPPGPDGRRGVAAGVAGLVYGWSPYVAERLLMGHWTLLLGVRRPAVDRAGRDCGCAPAFAARCPASSWPARWLLCRPPARCWPPGSCSSRSAGSAC